ncbi:MAG: LCP family protein [Bifidobacteriaceae bacterium]|nr:LCP family protein [Bifidobacteriaceae bacterium]
MQPRHAATHLPQPSKHRLTVNRHRGFKIAVTVVVALALSSGVAVAERLRQLDANIDVLHGVNDLLGLNRPDQEKGDGGGAPLDPFGGRSVNILITAIDTRDGDNAAVVREAGPKSATWTPSLLNDVNMIAHISKDRSRVDVVAIPRDTLIPIPACVRPDRSVAEPLRQEQINASFSRGAAGDSANKTEGVACVMKTIEQVTNIRLDTFILVDFAGFANVVDGLGGIDICVPDGLVGKESKINLPPGMNHLDGSTALAFARTRKGTTSAGRLDGSDTSRISRQQELIATVISEFMDSGNLQSLPKLNATATAITKSLYVGEELGSITSLAGLAYVLRDIKMANVSLFTAPWGEAPSDKDRVILAEWGTPGRFGGLNAQEVFQVMAADQPVPGTTPYKAAHPETPASTEPSTPPPDSSSKEPGATTDLPPSDDEFVTPLKAPTKC